jgi:antitoxin component YwqK of YwqJK toxin-antitoxin module
MYIKTMKQILTAVLLLSAIWAQNDGLVITNYPDGGLKVEGNYASGVRNGAWAEYWQEVWWFDYGEDGEANTKDTLENNGSWDSIGVLSGRRRLTRYSLHGSNACKRGIW